MPFTPFGFAPPGGSAGGALTGTYPNPGLSASAVAGAQDWPYLPADNGLLAVNVGDPALLTSAAVMTAGTLYLMKLNIRAAITATNLWFEISGAGSGASTGTFCGLYNSAGTLLTGSADIATQVSAVGPAQCALTSAQALAAGSFVWAALLSNLATTQPSPFKGATATGNVPNLGLTAATFRFATNGTGLVALPGSITPASNSAAALLSIWVGVS